jgi:hypothetical protein
MEKFMNKLDPDITEALVNQFYSNRFFLVGFVVYKLLAKGVDCSCIPYSLSKMTVYGYFLSSFPKLIHAMEGVDEYDLVDRLKVINLIKKTTPLKSIKWYKKDKYELKYDQKSYGNYAMYKSIVSNAVKDTGKVSVCAGFKVRVK